MSKNRPFRVFQHPATYSLLESRPRMKLSFDQMMRLLVCVGGLVFFGVGIWMIKSGISAQGVVDIKFREIISGHLETGSAGLFITFSSFLMIVLSFLLGKTSIASKPRDSQTTPSKVPVMVTLAVILWTVSTIFYLVSRSTKDGESDWFFYLCLFFFLYADIFTIKTYRVWNSEVEEKQKAINGKRDA